MTDLGEKIMGVLQHHRGKATAIDAHQLSALTGIRERKLRAEIHRLTVEDELAIATSMNQGYFIIVTPEEAEECTRRLWKHAISELVRVAKLRKLSQVQFHDLLDAEIGRLGLFDHGQGK